MNMNEKGGKLVVQNMCGMQSVQSLALKISRWKVVKKINPRRMRPVGVASTDLDEPEGSL